jgi:hypothetical protein
MPTFFDPTPEQKRELEKIAAGIGPVQQTLVKNHPQLTVPDRGAHQQQIAASKVLLKVADRLPAALDGLGIFERGSSHVGIGRISTGLGCPHAETNPDFLGLMVAFRTQAGNRIDFITINDPTSPTDTPEEFLALLQATADAAATTSLFASQATLIASLTRHAGVVGALRIAPHVTAQTHRTVRSSSAVQQYWTGIVRAREVLGKFTFVPAIDIPMGEARRAPNHLTQDWRNRQSDGPLQFDLRWIPFVDIRQTPTDDLTTPWAHGQEVSVGTVTFPKTDPDATTSKLTAVLAQELGANQGNWMETSDGPAAALPATRFTAARQLAYRASQQARKVLPEDRYASFFKDGEISQELAEELVRRYQEKQAAGHWVPDLGILSPFQ